MPRSHSWSGPAARAGRALAPGSPGAGSRAHTASTLAGSSRASTAQAPALFTAPPRNSTPTAPGLAGPHREARSCSGSGGGSCSPGAARPLPLLGPLPLQPVHGLRGGLPAAPLTERPMAAERASRQMVAEDLALVRSLS